MLNIAVCDDNRLFLDNLLKTLEDNLTEEHRLFGFSGPDELIEYIETHQQHAIDIVITDIKMPGIDGIEMAKESREMCPRLKFIFLTNYSEYVQDSFSVDPIYYLLKPVEINTLLTAISKAATALAEEDNDIVDIVSKKKLLRIKAREIKYIENIGRSAFIHELFDDVKLNMKLDDLQNKLPDGFVRTHKSYIVNINMIKSLSNNSIELFSGEIVPVAKAKYPEIRKTIIHYIGGTI